MLPAKSMSSSSIDQKQRPGTPASQGYFQPAEWAPHEACWLAWPSDAELWEDHLEPAQEEFTALCRSIDERLEILVPDAAARIQAEKALAGLSVRFHDMPFGDIWLRDTAPIFLTDDTQVSAACFRFNGWGEKYDLPYDDEVSLRIAKASGLPVFHSDWILEGGSVDVDGEGTCLTSKQCLLNPNRNSEMTQAQIEEALRASLGVKTVLWVNEGLLNDHTDGHIDTIARFVAPGKVICMEARDANDPNHRVLEHIAKDLARMKDARGRQLEVIRIPSPGRVLSDDYAVMPASFVNFYIANQTVIVPTYGSPFDAEAVEGIARCFPERKTVGLSAQAILNGGGAFHCITQQQPAVRKPGAPK